MAGNIEGAGARRGNRWRLAVWGGAAALLSLPFVAMQFTDEVQWTLSDFVVFGLLLLIVCSLFELAMRLLATRGARIVAAIAIVLGFLWVWAELAVGVFTDWGS